MDGIDELAGRLTGPRRRRKAIMRELHAHIEETRGDLVVAGWSPEDAAREAVSRLGNADEIAAGFSHAYRPSRRTQLGLALGLASTMLAGAFGLGSNLASARAVHHPAVRHHHTAPLHATCKHHHQV